MREQYEAIDALASLVVVAPHDREAVAAYWKKEALPFVGLPDPDGTLGRLWGQQQIWYKLGRMPATLVVDCRGEVAFSRYGASMSDIPEVPRLLDAVKALPPCPEGEGIAPSPSTVSPPAN